MCNSCLRHRSFINSTFFLVGWLPSWSWLAGIIVLDCPGLESVCCSHSAQRRTNLQNVSYSFGRVPVFGFFGIRMGPCRCFHIWHSESCSAMRGTWVRTGGMKSCISLCRWVGTSRDWRVSFLLSRHWVPWVLLVHHVIWTDALSRWIQPFPSRLIETFCHPAQSFAFFADFVFFILNYSFKSLGWWFLVVACTKVSRSAIVLFRRSWGLTCRRPLIESGHHLVLVLFCLHVHALVEHLNQPFVLFLDFSNYVFILIYLCLHLVDSSVQGIYFSVEMVDLILLCHYCSPKVLVFITTLFKCSS